MNSHQRPSPKIQMTNALIPIAIIVSLWMAVSFADAAQPRNVVLVHGAFADGSGWRSVSDILTHDGYKVSVAQLPETSLEDDVIATNRILDLQDGPVVLVGHSYGGAVITEAGNNPRVASLVYVAAFQPDAGESVANLLARLPAVSSDIVATKDGYLYLDQKAFAMDFAADLPRAQSSFMALSQVLTSAKAFNTAIVSPAWKVKPAYAIVATRDHAINPTLEYFMYNRSHSTTSEVAASHALYISQPRAVAEVIENAARHAQ